jgi:hypothetical protein
LSDHDSESSGFFKTNGNLAQNEDSKTQKAKRKETIKQQSQNLMEGVSREFAEAVLQKLSSKGKKTRNN